VLLAEFVRETLLSRVVIKGTDLHLVTTHTVTLDPLVLVGVVEPLDRGVALGALEALWTVLPPLRTLQGLAVFWRILEQVWRSTEIACVVRIDATF